MFEDTLRASRGMSTTLVVAGVGAGSDCIRPRPPTRYSSSSLAMLMSQLAAKSRMGCSRCAYLQSSWEAMAAGSAVAFRYMKSGRSYYVRASTAWRLPVIRDFEGGVGVNHSSYHVVPRGMPVFANPSANC